jgi:putative cell wall-binding protein
MGKKIRGLAAAAAAGALTLTMTPLAFAAVDDADDAFTPSIPSRGIHRIADKDRISTAVLASQSRSWGVVTKVDAGQNYWECTIPGDPWGVAARWGIQGTETNAAAGETEVQSYTAWVWDGREWQPETRQFTCTSTVARETVVNKDVHIIVARSDDFPDAIAASPLADVLNAPVLINPTDSLDPRVKNEIARLAGTVSGNGKTYVHLLGGTNALSHNVENAIDDVLGNKISTLRYQGVDRYQTAVNIASVTLNAYGIDSGNDTEDANVYLTTGLDFADALSGGAAAANNDGIVLLTQGEELDRRGFTDEYIIALRTWIDDDGTKVNTNETIAVGGPSARAAAKYDIRLAKKYVGANRFETAALAARGEFDLVNSDDALATQNFAVVSGVTYADALVASAYIANADGPLLLTLPNKLSPVTASYLNDAVDSNDRVFTFGGTGAMAKSVHDEIAAIFNR